MGKMQMFLEVKAVCEGKPLVWRGAPGFTEAFADFCFSIEKIKRLSAAAGIFHLVDKRIPVEMAVADTILTTGMDNYMEEFEPVDVALAFVDDYTKARSMEIGVTIS